MLHKTTALSAAIVAALACATMTAQAQETPAATENAQTEAPAEMLIDIVVTARRRAEPLQSTPLAVSALSSVDIESRVALNIVDLGKSMPNVRIDALGSQGRAGMLAIRGVNYARSDQAGDPSTAFYIDGLYQARSTLNILDMFDIESLEVLRGPQGTLFGRNAFAGAVNIQSKRPTMETGAEAEVRVGNFGRREIRGAVNLPIVSDVLAMRASLLYTESNGYYHSIRDNGNRLGGDDNITGRASFLYTPTDRLNVFLKYEHIRDRGDPTPAKNASTPASLATPEVTAQFLGNIPGDPPNFYTHGKFWTNVNIPEGQRSFVDQNNVALNINYDLEGGSLTSITGYQHSKDALITDPIGGSINYITSNYRTRVESISQELRLLKELGDRFQILVGGYYSDDDLAYGAITFSEYGPLLGANAQVRAKQKRKSYAAFAELEWRVADDVRLNFAGRQMWEDKDFAFNRTLRPVAQNISPGTLLPVADSGYARDSAKWNNFSPKVSADWRPTEDIMLYASWTKGFKSGGYAALTTSIDLAGPYEPEKIETWEAGIKTFLFDRRVKANLTLFWNNLDDLQRSVNFTVAGVASNIVFNAASAVTKGVEAEFEYAPTDALRLRASAGYLKAYYKDFCANFSPAPIAGQPRGAACGTEPGAVDNSALPLYNAPKWQAAAGGSYRFELGGAGSLTFYADLNYTSSLYTNDTPWPASLRGKMTIVDGNIQWKSADERYYASIYGHNLFNEIDTQQGIRSSGTLTVFNYTQPRRYGAAFGVRF